MATAEEIKLIVSAEVSKAISDMKKFDSQIGKTSKESESLSKSLQKVTIGFAAFAAGAGTVFAILKKTVDAASNLEEATAKFNTVFGESEEVMRIGSEAITELTESYIMSEREAKQYMGSMQDLLVPMGMLPDKAAQMSTELVKLSADLGSFNNMPTANVMADIQSAMVGNFETMKKYGVVLNETRVKQEAMNMGLYNGKGVLDAVTKSQVAYKLIMQDTAAAHGDVERTAGSWANRMKQLEATMEDFSAEIGKELIPVLDQMMNSFSSSREETLNFARGLGVLTAKLMEAGKEFINISAASGGFGAVLKYNVVALGWAKDQIAKLGAAKRQDEKETQKLISSGKDYWSKLLNVGGPAIKATTKSTKKMGAAARKTGNDFHKGKQRAVLAMQEFLAAGEQSAAEEIAKENTKYEKLKSQAQKYRLSTEELERKHQENIQTIKQEFENQEAERRMENFESFLGFTQQATTQISGIFGQYYKNQNIQLNNDYKKRKKAIQDNVKDEEEKKKQMAALDEEFQKKRAKLAVQQAKTEKAIALVSAIQSTARGVAGALGSPPYGPGAIAMASIIGALGAAQVALIAKQPIPEAAEGGIIPGSSAGTILRAGEGGRSEAIIPFENEDAMSRIGGPQITVNLNIENAFTNEDFPEQVAVRIDQALSKLVQDRNSRLQDSL